MIGVSKRDRLISSVRRIAAAVKKAARKAIKPNGGYLSKNSFVAKTLGKFTCSFWINFDASVYGNVFILYKDASNSVKVYVSGTTVQFFLTTNNVTVCQTYSPGFVLTTGGWHNFIFYFTGSTLQIAYDGTYSNGQTLNSLTASDLSAWNIHFFSDQNGANKISPKLYDFVFYAGQGLDLNNPVIQKFRTSAGKPADLGADGSIPFGVAADIYLKGDSTSFGVNSGTAGDFIVNGSFTDVDASI